MSLGVTDTIGCALTDKSGLRVKFHTKRTRRVSTAPARSTNTLLMVSEPDALVSITVFRTH